MNAEETIQAAIDKLTRLRDAADQGRWTTGWDGQEFYIQGFNAAETWPGHGDRVAEWTYAIDPGNSAQMDECGTSNAELIVTLHATIDAQLAFLHRALSFESLYGFAPEDMALARAILGEQATDD